MPSAQLLTTQEVADYAGLSVASIRTYRVRKCIPEPEYIGSTPVWRLSDIQRWLRTRPARGRPVKKAS